MWMDKFTLSRPFSFRKAIWHMGTKSRTTQSYQSYKVDIGIESRTTQSYKIDIEIESRTTRSYKVGIESRTTWSYKVDTFTQKPTRKEKYTDAYFILRRNIQINILTPLSVRKDMIHLEYEMSNLSMSIVLMSKSFQKIICEALHMHFFFGFPNLTFVISKWL